MKKYIISLLIVCVSGCSSNNVQVKNPIHEEINYREPSHIFSVQEGAFLGYDYGEFEKGLYFKNKEGLIYSIIGENVLGIYSSKDTIFVFTGISHLLINEGAIYRIENGSNARPQAKKIKDLPGKPFSFHFIKEKGVSFMVKGECYLVNFNTPHAVIKCPL